MEGRVEGDKNDTEEMSENLLVEIIIKHIRSTAC